MTVSRDELPSGNFGTLVTELNCRSSSFDIDYNIITCIHVLDRGNLLM